MTRRPHRQFRIPVYGAALLLSAGILLPAAPASAVPDQEPGVTLRVFDVQVPLDRLCKLKVGQTPNVDKLMSTIDWSSAADFGFEDHFVAQALGNLDVTTAGDYEFRLVSDDGSRLLIDDSVVVDHDGRHGPTAKDGAVNLAAGLHPLRIDHFERDGGQQLTLQWKTPGSSSFELVPNSALSTDAGVVRVTAPGKKECEGDADSGGDGLPLTGVHPSFTLTNLRPDGFQPKVTGMDWLADGRLVISTWGGNDQSGTSQDGEVYILDNTGGSTGPGSVTTKRIASGLKEPMGLKIVDGVVYVSEKQRLTRLVDTNDDEVTDQYQTVATWPYGENFHEFAFGLLYADGYFYLNLSVSIDHGGATTDPQPAPNRGTTIKINENTGEVSYVAGGLRTPHGIGWGPENGIFVTDNQGGWLPSSKLLHIKQDRFFNHYTTPAGPFDDRPVTAPVLWMPQNEIANSPSSPVMMTEGPFAGQMAIGDVTYGGLQRAFLEKVDGEYQGALFRMTQGLEAGVSEVNVGPDGALYVGGIAGDGNWGQEGKLPYGLQKLTPNGTSTFDILAMRAIAGGFELEYTQPLSAETATNLLSRYAVAQWRYEATAGYGGPKIDEENLTVTSATLSADGKKVTLGVAGLKAGHVVHVRSPRPFASASGQSLWSTEAWYTLNNLVEGTPPPGDRVTLFDGSDLGNWESTDDSPATWPVADGSMEALGGDIRTKQSYGDFHLHVEWLEPDLPPDVTGQARGNSGVYLQDRYEIQVLDSYGVSTLADDQAGAIYGQRAPDSNAATAPGTWQTYDITFRAARFNAAGNKTANARVTVVWNGATVHDDVELEGPTGGGAEETASAGPIRLQDHGDPGENVRYRNIWIEPLN